MHGIPAFRAFSRSFVVDSGLKPRNPRKDTKTNLRSPAKLRPRNVKRRPGLGSLACKIIARNRGYIRGGVKNAGTLKGEQRAFPQRLPPRPTALLMVRVSPRALTVT